MRFLLNAFFSRKASLVSAVAQEAASAYRLSFLTTAVRSGLLLHLKEPRTFEELSKKYVGRPQAFSSMSKLEQDTTMAVRQRALDNLLHIGVNLGELRLYKEKYTLHGRFAKELAEPGNEDAAMLAVETHEIHLPTIGRSMKLLKDGTSQPPLDSETEHIVNATRDIALPALREVLRRTIPLQGKFRVLEVGCGPQPAAVELCLLNKEAVAIAIDTDGNSVRQARRCVSDFDLDMRISVHQLSPQDMQRRSNMFDIAIIHNRLHLIAAQAQASIIRDMHRLLADGGQVVVTQSVGDRRDIHTDATDLWVCLTEGLAPLPNINTVEGWLALPGFTDVRVKQLPLSGMVYATGIKHAVMSGTPESAGVSGGTALAADLPSSGDKD